MKRFYLLALVFLMAVTITGCSLVEDKSVAENVVKNYFELIKDKNFEKTLTLYSKQFFEKTKKEDWLQILKNINGKLGDLQKYELIRWNINKRVGTGSGTYFSLQYQVTYSKYPANESFTIFKKRRGSELRIVGHFINSQGLLLE